jgi:cell division protein FtsW (lipid II flippase)
MAALFLTLYALALTLSPAARARSWEVDYRWGHWLGLAMWAVFVVLAHRQIVRHLPDSDPYLLPAAALLTGWGILSIWRLVPAFGIRQGLWMLFSGGLFILGIKAARNLDLLRRYKYIFLFSGLILTALTLFFGANPGGSGPRLWLGCCGLYFQPSEPLKLLLIVYLAAYFADRLPIRTRLFPLIFPTLVLTGLALTILLIQRDLGTASIFIFLYATMVYFASGKKRLLLGSLGLLAVAGLIGYFMVDIIQVRLDAWLDPWVDPAGRSFQIIQSLLAVANGGFLGRGPGLGSPGLVPVAISDFIFTAISEETGLLGTFALFSIIGILITRGFLIAIKAASNFRRLLAAGLTAYLGAQSILIIGGNLRLLPLTGVTLPFVSYGGSSLLTSFLALLILLQISNEVDEEPAALPQPKPYLVMAGLIWLGLFACALANGWWAIVRSDDLLTRTDNARRSIADRFVRRGSLLDRNNLAINTTSGEAGSYIRTYNAPALSPITGYTHPIFGQAGLEESLDPYLRGLQGSPYSLVWWEHLLYGQPPPGLNVRTSLDLGIQAQADSLLGEHTGAVVLLNAQTGEILAMASHPTFDANQLDTLGDSLAQDETSPLLNRAIQGQYPVRAALKPFLLAAFGDASNVPDSDLGTLYNKLGFYSAPAANIPAPPAAAQGTVTNLRVSPLQMALASAALSNGGIRPAPQLALAVETATQGWVVFRPLTESSAALNAHLVEKAALTLTSPGNPFWEYTATQPETRAAISWYLAGTLPNWQGIPLTIVVALENDDPALARSIGRGVLKRAVQP